ncbi:hypothetical protein [Rhabdochlamydiaceae symbiont of Dictyostelium giganteum]|uniref:hypothetical protein n=1 Tax=Rhabdochlamydiaceae symbiont of Dictyostelium giganteum TaxID=3342349 RepID=UPI00384D5334
MSTSNWCTLSFTDLITGYKQVQSRLTSRVKGLASNMSNATPGQFLLIQFMMSQVTQIGDSISNLIGQVQSMINNSVRNQKSS